MNDKNGLMARSLAEPSSAKIARQTSITISRALILTADECASATLPGIIQQSGLQPIAIGTIRHLRSYRLNSAISLLLCEDRLPDGTFRDALNVLRGMERRTPVIVFSRIAEWENYLEAVRCGAYDCLRYPFRAGELQRIIFQLLLEQQPFSASEANCS
jgi:DNA-binding NtrC family response regulator